MHRNITTARIAIALVWLCAGLHRADCQETTPELNAGSLDNISAVSQIQLSNVFDGWQQIANKYRDCTLTWKRADPTPPVSRFNAETASTAPSTLSNQHLTIRGHDFYLESARIAISEMERYRDIAVNAPVSVYLPERGANPFFGQLYSRFQRPAPLATWQPFERQFCDGRLLDYWHAVDQQLPRAAARSLPRYGTSGWATMRIEPEDNEHLASLDLWAALLSLRPSASLFNIRVENCRIAPVPSQIDERDCYRVTENVASEAGSRIWFVEADPPHVVRRYIGTGEKDGVQVDIQWAGKNGENRPVGWHYMLFQNGEAPITFFGRSVASSLETIETMLPKQIDLDALPVGTWVVDDAAEQQYLIGKVARRRIIEPHELSWLPLHSELLQTDSGEVSALIQRKIVWRKLLRGEVNLTLVLSILFLGGVAIFYIRRRLVGGPMSGE